MVRGGTSDGDRVLYTVTAARPSRVRWPLIVGVVVLVLLVVVGDWYQRNRELDQLLTAASSGSQALSTLSTALSNDKAESQSAQRRDNLAAASEAASKFRYAGTKVQDVHVMPWHRALHDAQQKYSVYAQSGLVVLDIMADGKPGEESAAATADTEHRVAADAYRAAVPPLALGNPDARIASIFDK